MIDSSPCSSDGMSIKEYQFPSFEEDCSSPIRGDQGEVSPGFDASFNTSMNISDYIAKESEMETSSPVLQRTATATTIPPPPMQSAPLLTVNSRAVFDSVVTGTSTGLPIKKTRSSSRAEKFPFLNSLGLFNNQNNGNVTSNSAGSGNGKESASGVEKGTSRFRVPPLDIPGSSTSLSSTSTLAPNLFSIQTKQNEPSKSTKFRGQIPFDWQANKSPATAPLDGFFSWTPAGPLKDETSFSSDQMDVDSPIRTTSDIPSTPQRISPTNSECSPRSDRFADLFNDPSSPFHIPISRKRMLELENSPTPGGEMGNIGDLCAGPMKIARSFDNSADGPAEHSIRKRKSYSGLSRKPLATIGPTGVGSGVGLGEPFMENYEYKRQAQTLNGRPSMKPFRRAFSVVDATLNSGGGGNVVGAEKENETKKHRKTLTAARTFLDVETSRAALACSPKQQKTFMVDTGSPVAGFRMQEGRGKSLPCFGVKEDGLMRISPETLYQLKAGSFAGIVNTFVVIDCRFDWEYKGGHIAGAINLSSPADIEAALLEGKDLPKPSTSETVPAGEKHVLIFHCEFSAKRAPTGAKHLRNKDRHMNQKVYPSVHYPEVYILQGGYAGFYKKYPDSCDGGYTPMDDPQHNSKRVADLHLFRQQNRSFSRASSFTFGEAQQAARMVKAAPSNSQPPPPQMSFDRPSSASSDAPSFNLLTKPRTFSMSGSQLIISEEDHEGDSSIGSIGGDSPCASTKIGRHSLRLGGLSERRPLGRAHTSSVLSFHR